MEKWLHEIDLMSDAELRAEWETLDQSDPDDFYDAEQGVTVRQYADALKSAMKRRNIALAECTTADSEELVLIGKYQRHRLLLRPSHPYLGW